MLLLGWVGTILHRIFFSGKLVSQNAAKVLAPLFLSVMPFQAVRVLCFCVFVESSQGWKRPWHPNNYMFSISPRTARGKWTWMHCSRARRMNVKLPVMCGLVSRNWAKASRKLVPCIPFCNLRHVAVQLAATESCIRRDGSRWLTT